jgi:uncharacterized RDD family membrane protein YckC
VATNVRDPRSIITPDAFTVSEALLGIPLARPSRRFWALVIDVVVIAVLNAVTDSISLFIWGGVGLFLVFMAFRKPAPKRSPSTGRLFRGATGCLGAVVLTGVLLGGLGGMLLSSLGDDGPPDPARVEQIAARVESGDLSDLAELGPLSGLVQSGGRAALRQSQDTASARGAAVVILIAASSSELPRSAWPELLAEATPDDVAWADDARVVHERAIAEAERQLARRGAPPPADVRVDETTVDSLRARAAAMDDATLLATWLEVVRGGDAGDATPETPDSADAEAAARMLVEAERRRILQAQVVQRFAADTVASLNDEIALQRTRRGQAEDEAESLRAELDEQAGSFTALLADIWDQLGSAFGLWSIYFTVALTVTGGRTVGKKLMGVRVVRLDGEPLNWWASFERAGGYAAGIATGTLGFVQIFWDANRQAVHDKIGGTVVVVDGAEPVPGAWEQAWQASAGERSEESPGVAGQRVG